MVLSLWLFLQNDPESSVPFPWERCFDVKTEVLFYKNTMNGTMVIDLRSRVNLGGGFFHLSDIWYDLTGRCCHYHHPICYMNGDYDQDLPFIISASCCGPIFYLIVPEMANSCPICDCQVLYIG